MRCSESERSDAIRGRPIVRNPLHKLPRKLTPVRTIMIRIMRSYLKVLFSILTGTCNKRSKTDSVLSGALELTRTGRGT